MHLFRRAADLCRDGQNVALATVVATRGSTPRHPGATMLVLEDGNIFGTIGGGRIELEVIEAARAVAAGDAARIVEHHLTRDLAMCCGGSMSVYVEPVGPSADVLSRAAELVADRRSGLLVTPLSGAPKTLDTTAAPGSPRRAPRLEHDRFVQPIGPDDRLIVFGLGHVARAIGPLAADCGFEVIVCDDGETGALADSPGWASEIVPSFEPSDLERAIGPLGASDYVLVVTRDHGIDQRLVEKLLPNDALTYLGLIGSRGKIGRFEKRLRAKGIADDERWARLRAPIGLEIGAETPSEIAVATVAELIRVRNQGSEPA